MSARHLRNKPEDEDASQLKFGPEFSGKTQEQCLSTSEVRILLESVGRSGTENPIYKRTLDYVTEFARFRDPETMNSVRQVLSVVEGLSPFEVVQISNLVPSSVEEARALIPSLANKKEEQLEESIRQVVSLRKYQG